MPGYSRACTDHTFHVLLATLNKYLDSRQDIPQAQRTARWLVDVENVTSQRDTLVTLLAGAVPTMPTLKPKPAPATKATKS